MKTSFLFFAIVSLSRISQAHAYTRPDLCLIRLESDGGRIDLPYSRSVGFNFSTRGFYGNTSFKSMIEEAKVEKNSTVPSLTSANLSATDRQIKVLSQLLDFGMTVKIECSPQDDNSGATFVATLFGVEFLEVESLSFEYFLKPDETFDTIISQIAEITNARLIKHFANYLVKRLNSEPYEALSMEMQSIRDVLAVYDEELGWRVKDNLPPPDSLQERALLHVLRNQGPFVKATRHD